MEFVDYLETTPAKWAGVLPDCCPNYCNEGEGFGPEAVETDPKEDWIIGYYQCSSCEERWQCGFKRSLFLGHGWRAAAMQIEKGIRRRSPARTAPRRHQRPVPIEPAPQRGVIYVPDCPLGCKHHPAWL